MPGYATQHFGRAPYGVGTPATAPDPRGKILRDPTTGLSTGSRRINPRTRDYEVDEFGRILGMDDLRQLVQLAISTEKGSSAMRALGHELRKIDRVTTNFVRRVESTLAGALAHLTDKGLIAVVAVSVVMATPARAVIRMRWRDLATSRELLEEVS